MPFTRNPNKMTDYEFQKTLFYGVIMGVCFTLLGFVIMRPASITDKPPSTKSNFEVVDTYKGCDLVRYNNGMLAEYKYVLYCNNTHPAYEK